MAYKFAIQIPLFQWTTRIDYLGAKSSNLLALEHKQRKQIMLIQTNKKDSLILFILNLEVIANIVLSHLFPVCSNNCELPYWHTVMCFFFPVLSSDPSCKCKTLADA